MRFYIVFIEVKDLNLTKEILLDFKEKMKNQGNLEVIETEQTNYDFLLNSMIERANAIRKGR
jgi:hypothetical protein